MSNCEKQSLNLLWAGFIVEELARHQCIYVCAGSGSRSTPLIIAGARHPQVHLHMTIDERGAAFRALGYARATGRPGVVVTTSGTAAANVLPAVVEASMDDVPLIVLTADRPPELIDTGANQTIVQPGLFSTYVRWQADMPCPNPEISPAYVLTSLDQAIYRSRGPHAGPVHLNCHFREPLIDQAALDVTAYTRTLQAWQGSADPFTTYADTVVGPSAAATDAIRRIIEETEKGLLVIGGLACDVERAAARRVIAHLAWPVYADLSSGLRLAEVGTHIIRYFDQTLLPASVNTFCRAQTVLHLGGRITSKRLPLFLQQNRPDRYVMVRNSPARLDSIHAVTHRFQCNLEVFANHVTASPTGSPSPVYADFFRQAAGAVDAMIDRHIREYPSVSEPYVARCLTARIPDGSALFVSSSMPIRDVDIYGTHQRGDIRVGVNRGASGIDGVISTAVGFAEGSRRPTTVLVGDLATIHDMNALSLLGACTQPVIVVIINNHGGGIFRFLPVAAQTDVFNEYFVTPHQMSFAGIAQSCRIPYACPAHKAAFVQAYDQAVAAGGSVVIEVVTDGQKNHDFRKTLKQAILRELPLLLDRMEL